MRDLGDTAANDGLLGLRGTPTMRALRTTGTLAAVYVSAGLVAGLSTGLVAGWPGQADAAPRAKKPAPKTPEQKEADRHFKSGVALFKEAKYAEALAEFQRAYEIAPQPIVLYNIAGCHRELSHYKEAVSYYRQFLSEGAESKDKVPAARLAAAQDELDGILARIARVKVTVSPDAGGVALSLDGVPLDSPEMPLILPPGEHRLTVHADGRRDAERSVRVASGDNVTVEVVLEQLPPPPPEKLVTVERELPVAVAPPPPPSAKHFALSAGFATNLRRTNDTGAPSLGLSVALGSRVELGVDGLLVAYAAMPSLSVRVIGETLSLHLIGAAPISFNDGTMKQTFVAGAGGLGIRYRPTASLAFRLESLASFAGAAHGMTIPTFLRGELWF